MESQLNENRNPLSPKTPRNSRKTWWQNQSSHLNILERMFSSAWSYNNKNSNHLNFSENPVMKDIYNYNEQAVLNIPRRVQLVSMR